MVGHQLTDRLSGAGSSEVKAGQTRLFVQRALGRNCRLDSDGKETSVKKRGFKIKQFPNLQ